MITDFGGASATLARPAKDGYNRAMLKLPLYHDMYSVDTSPLAELNAALRHDPTNAELYHLRGIANFQAFEFRAATADFTRAIELRPDYVEAIFHRGIVRTVRGRYDDAVQDFDRVIGLDPKHGAAYYNRGRLRYWKGHIKGAIADFEAARQLDSQLSRKLNLRHMIGTLKRGPQNDSLLGHVQGLVDRLIDL